MCGIAGIYFGDGRPIDRVALKRMGDAIAHRGPDGEGFHVETSGASIGLVNRRLAVIDVEGGQQPITIADGRYTIVYNGELFNTGELRRELESRGHRFRTRCDTEVVVRGYAEWGAGVLDRMLGMWALCIWDRDERKAFLARDRLGVKPLVYAEVPGGIVFGSEIKALVASGLVQRTLDIQALPFFLSSFTIPEPHTLVTGARRLRSAHALEVTRGGIREFEYWDCSATEELDRGRAHYREEVGSLLEDAVRRRLVSDVPLGVLLSSGVDSRLIATYATRANPAVRTFTLGFDQPTADERSEAGRAATELHTRHTSTVMDASAAAAALPTLLEAYDEPGESLVQTNFVSEFARRHVTVALSGLGGDELFSSYPTHVAVNLLARVDRAPRFAADLLNTASKLAPSRRVKRLADLASLPADARVSRELLHQTPASLRSSLLSRDVRGAVDLDAPVRHLEEHFSRTRARHPLNRLLYVYLKTYVPDELLRATDMMSMLHSLEVRVPFLDHRLVERAMVIPARHKMHTTRGKLLLHDLAAQMWQHSARAPKRGFAPPVGAWLRGPLGEQVQAALSETAVVRRGVFDPAVVTQVLGDCLAGDDRLEPAVMMLYSFEIWAQRWLDQQPQPPVQERPVVLNGRPALSVVIVNWNTSELTSNCLRSVRRHLASIAHEVIVVDNASQDGSPEQIEREFPEVRLIRNSTNTGFGVANNQGMAAAKGEWLLLLNSDTELLDGSVQELFERVRYETRLGVAHCQLRFPDGRLQHSAYRFPSVRLAVFENLGLYKLTPRLTPTTLLGGYWNYREEREVDWVAGAFMLLPQRVYEDTGGFDERIFMYGEDMEWCYRIRQGGWRIRYYPSATVMHVDHASSEIRWGDERIALCLRRQHEIYTERAGLGRAMLLVWLGVVGSSMRLLYYECRGRVGSRREAYRAQGRFQRSVLRTLVSMALGQG